MEKFWQWLVQSSADPTQVALTVKGVFTGLIPAVAFVAPYLHLHILPENLEALGELARLFIITSFGILAALMTAFGIIRKIANLVRDIFSKK